jgi:CheY-like chemotaxis protein
MGNPTRSAISPNAMHSENATRPAASQSEATSPAGAYRLLVVDDEPAIRDVTAAMLTEEGFEVVTAQDGAEALDLLPLFRPHLVITDLRMPRMSGFELLKVLRQRFTRLPVIAVSGASPGDGVSPTVIADAFLPKAGGGYIAALRTKVMELLSTVARSSTPQISGEPNS